MTASRLAWPARLGFAALLALALPVAVVSLRYLAPMPPGAPPEVLANRFADPFLALHAGFGAMALALGPFQFLPRLRARFTPLHRTIGALYVTACLAGGAAGLLLALGSTAGPVASAGFGGLAIAWLFTTSRGVAAVLAGRFAAHRRWMIRSFALTLAAVTLRLQLPASAMLGIGFETAYLWISFTCWVPNLLAAELWVALTRVRAGFQNQPALRSFG